MDVKECIRKRILREISSDIKKSESSIKIAKSKLIETRKLFASEFFNNSVLSIYTSMFHAARALLYKDGIQEKSHYATYIYINEKYSDRIPRQLINAFNLLREDRHEILYGFQQNSSREEVENFILDLEEFLAVIEKILKNETKKT
ncbi:MAG: HEPN domain-containing protein [Nanoarchaeota archaeon]|nr:HEPN domain-containing protein [Nanoarchaeota archaeon]MBU1027536.1 HEPN domain-containing protein [Nanoarchaeota archaeon]